jgi:signal transduction histidine kinase/CheY-like chemotaxis protein
MILSVALAAMTCALAIYVAALHHRIARAPGWREQRWFCWVALSVAGYEALNIPIALGSDAVVLAAGRSQLCFAGLHSAAWLLYSRGHLGQLRRRWEAVLAGTVGGLAVIALLPGAVYQDPVRRTTFALLDVPYAVPTTTLLGDLFLLASVGTLGIVTVRYGVASWNRSPYALTHFTALSVFFALVGNDALVAAGAYPGPYLVDLGIVLPVAAVGYVLTSRFAADARALADLRTRLESLVEERTRQLSETQAALHRSEKLAALAQFSTGVAHEVNNPAAVVSANLKYLERCLQEDGLPLDALECIRESMTSVERITKIMRQLLTAGRLAASNASLEPVSVAGCAREALATARARVPPLIALGLAIDESLLAQARQEVLLQVLVNLVVNGAQAIPEERKGRVSIRAEKVEGRVRIYVDDDGAGMNDETLRRVFEPFFSTKPLGVGTGLGLAVSRGLVVGLGGTLELQSVVGRGTRAIVELAAAGGPLERAQEAEPLAPKGRRRDLLLVEDDPVVRRALARLLEPHYALYVAASVGEALALADLRSPDVVLCDVIMPDGGGDALYRQLREHFPDLASRVIFITGGASTETARDFLAGQLQPVLQKPLDLQVLAPIVERLAPDALAAAAPREGQR